jgi:hypothetical protein
VFVEEQKKKAAIAKRFPQLKYDEIELLSKIVSNDELEKYAQDSGD